ncbi:YdcF family protein [Nocardia sp. SYP-A9097]|uniref:YdcF family protein n=1 Tax=Nocardia sp. SYP-A9097 TaxID=2663237 RepID=UPI00129B61DE|nr:YdcF family protein [Nocardia sp. SYP-A9097]MRH89959.1 YdcF family protein [Nocardia sp. SYP-A9097]
MATPTVPAMYRSDVETLWDYNQMHHEPHPVDVAVGLGGHDIGVATYAADLYRAGVFPLIVFTGANAPTTVDRFPRGEAVHFRERAIELGVPEHAILVEPYATNTGDNIDFSRTLLADREYLGSTKSVMLISRPYQQRRSYAICRKRWPEVEVICGSLPLGLDDYVAGIGDVDRVMNMLVGDTQRIWVYAAKGWAIEQDVPDEVRMAYSRLVNAGFTRRLLPV